MATLPLYDPTPPHADGWHRVTAPGGYEWWYFDAEDETGDVRLVAILFQGFVFHPGYLRRHAAYLRRPTRRPPALPAEYPCAYFIVYERGRVVAQFMHRYAPEQFEASPHEPNVRVGPNRLLNGAGGTLALTLSGTPWELGGTGPTLLSTQKLAAELWFTPRLPHGPHERPFFSRDWAGADHRWVIANPLCGVSGTIRLTGGDAPREVRFAGRGYHDHNYGSGPIGPGLRRWLWGRVLADDRAETFHLAVPRDPSRPAEFHLVEADASGVRAVKAPPPALAWSRRALGLAYPETIDLGRGLLLRSPTVVDAAPFYLRVAYETTHRGRQGTAFCEVAYPHRLRWPVLGRMIELSISPGPAAGMTM